ncbi:hypothetical protein SPFM14_00160 [Salmonella phage SPFM14]|nr:hypothetical protein SPFM14_00160 [Salmonella phage SPFM14]
MAEETPRYPIEVMRAGTIMISPRIELDGFDGYFQLRGEFTPHGPLKALVRCIELVRVCGYVSNVCYGVDAPVIKPCQSFGEVKAAIDRTRPDETISLALRRGHVFCEFAVASASGLILSIPCDEFKDSD